MNLVLRISVEQLLKVFYYQWVHYFTTDKKPEGQFRETICQWENTREYFEAHRMRRVHTAKRDSEATVLNPLQLQDMCFRRGLKTEATVL